MRSRLLVTALTLLIPAAAPATESVPPFCFGRIRALVRATEPYFQPSQIKRIYKNLGQVPEKREELISRLEEARRVYDKDMDWGRELYIDVEDDIQRAVHEKWGIESPPKDSAVRRPDPGEPIVPRKNTRPDEGELQTVGREKGPADFREVSLESEVRAALDELDRGALSADDKLELESKLDSFNRLTERERELRVRAVDAMGTPRWSADLDSVRDALLREQAEFLERINAWSLQRRMAKKPALGLSASEKEILEGVRHPLRAHVERLVARLASLSERRRSLMEFRTLVARIQETEARISTRTFPAEKARLQRELVDRVRELKALRHRIRDAAAGAS